MSRQECIWKNTTKILLRNIISCTNAPTCIQIGNFYMWLDTQFLLQFRMPRACSTVANIFVRSYRNSNSTSNCSMFGIGFETQQKMSFSLTNTYIVQRIFVNLWYSVWRSLEYIEQGFLTKWNILVLPQILSHHNI